MPCYRNLTVLNYGKSKHKVMLSMGGGVEGLLMRGVRRGLWGKLMGVGGERTKLLRSLSSNSDYTTFMTSYNFSEDIC